MSKVRIGDRWVGDGEPCYIIAEAGSNHLGRLDVARRLIDVAAQAGAQAVKFQTFRAQTLYPPSAGPSDYLHAPRSIYEVIRELEMPEDWIPLLAEHCRAEGVAFLSTPFDERAVDLLAPYVPAFKIASYELTHAPLLRHAARQGKPLLLSTGAATLAEVLEAVATVRAASNEHLVLLHCTATYPAPPDALNLRAIATLRTAARRPVGLSDHSRDPTLAPLLAVALGASVLEKHLTLGSTLPGPDHSFAVEPREFAELVRRVREAEAALGHGRKEPLPVEAELRAFARRSIFSTRDIAPGERLGPGNVAVLRCGKLGFGLPPSAYDAVLDRTAARPIPRDTPIGWEDLG